MKKSHKALPNQQELGNMKPWGYLAPPQNFELSEERRAQGWEQGDIPKAKELNQWQNEKDKRLIAILRELLTLIKLSDSNTDEQMETPISGSALKEAIQRLCMQSLQKDPKTHFKLSPVGTIYPYNNEFGEWQDNVTLPGWVACIYNNSQTIYTTVDGQQYYVPDLGDTFTCGAGAPDEVGNTGGADKIQLTVAMLPQHKHDCNHTHSINYSSTTPSYYQHNWFFGYLYARYLRQWWTGDRGSTSWNGNQIVQDITVNSVELQTPDYTLRVKGNTRHTESMDNSYSDTGGGQAFDNQPLYRKALYIIKIQDLEGTL